MLFEALGRGDIDRMLELAEDLLKRWPRERIQDSHGWYILAIMSQVGFDTRRFGIAAKELSRKVALTARLSYYRTSCMADVICRTVALSAFEDLVEEQVMRCLAVDGHWGHYSASRLGLAAFRQKKLDILKLCLARSRSFDGTSTSVVNVELEVTQLENFVAILEGRPPNFERMLQLLRDSEQHIQVRYYHTLNQILDPEDFQEFIAEGRLGTRHAMLVD